MPAHATREDDLKALRARIEALRTEIESRESDRREARDALRASETAISEATRALAGLEAESRQLRTSAGQLAAQQRALEQQLAGREAALGRLLAARSAAQAPDFLRLTLSGEDPNEVARRLHYLSVVSKAVARVIEKHRADLGELARLRAASAERANALREVEVRQRADRARVLAERRERQRVLEQIASELRSGRRRIERMVADEKRLARVVQEIGRVLAARPGAGFRRGETATPSAATPVGPFASLRGALRWPVRGELAAAERAPRKSARTAGRGVFIRAPQGDAVSAVAAGRVVFADWMRGFGNLLIIDHGDAYLSVYGHNESLLKRAGDAVGDGEAIATVGASGGREESGVYFELRHEGEILDPASWVRTR